MRILLLTHFYPPEIGAPQRRWSALVSRWLADGHRVTVVTAQPHYPSGRRVPATTGPSFRSSAGPFGETVVRVPFVAGDPTSRRKLMDQALVAALSIPAAVVRDADVVVATVPGLPTLVAGLLVARARRRPLVLELRDAWPDLMTESGMASGRAGRAMERGVTEMQRRCDAIVTVSEDFARVLERRGLGKDGHVAVIPNGVDPDHVPLLAPPASVGPLRVLYLGTHGVSQGLESAVRAAAALGPAAVEITFIGDGAERPRLRELARSIGAPVTFHDPVSGAGLWNAYRDADTCLVSLRDWSAFRYTIPSKLYEVFATGRHVTASVAGEAARLVHDADAGTVVPPDDPDALAESWRVLERDRTELTRPRASRAWVCGHASYDHLADAYLEVLTRTVKEAA